METIYKTIYQYNQAPIPPADMKKLQEVAEACRKVKNYVYHRYSGIHSLPKLSPGYTVQNEMTKSGLREQLGLPSVYFCLAVFDALGDIKSGWAHTKAVVEKNLRANPNLTEEDRHYLRFVMKQGRCFEAALEGTQARLEGEWAERYGEMRARVDARRLDSYLRRQVRRHQAKPHTEAADGFAAAPKKGYRYADHGIYLSTKEKGKRVFIPLTDNNRYERQIHIRLYPEEGNITINVPVEVRKRHPQGYAGELGLAAGLKCMFVTDQGNAYGERYLEYQSAVTDYVREKLPGHQRNARNNPGRKKYNAGKERLENALHGYVNAEINRMLRTEKPKTVYLPKLPATSKAGVNKRRNATVSMWQKGYVKKRLRQKCLERSIELIEVFGKGISAECSGCGSAGGKESERFCCPSCGLELPERQNTARNALKRGRAQKERLSPREKESPGRKNGSAGEGDPGKEGTP